jgi:hypothetical protein
VLVLDAVPKLLLLRLHAQARHDCQESIPNNFLVSPGSLFRLFAFFYFIFTFAAILFQRRRRFAEEKKPHIS